MSESFLSVGQTTRVGGPVAILVDGENIPHSALALIEAAASDLGRVAIRRVYGDMTTRRDWDNEACYHSIHTGNRAGKNCADIRLTVDAVDLAHRGNAMAFVIASSDSDFSHLAIWMREADFPMIGVGLGHTAQSYRQVCAAFRVFTPVVPAQSLAKQKLSPLDDSLHRAIRGAPAQNGVTLKDLGNLMKGEPVKTQTGMGSWRAYLDSRKDLYAIKPVGLESRVALVNP